MKLRYTDLWPHFLSSAWFFFKSALLIVLFYVLFFSSLLFSFTVVASGSMTPTCETNDIVICSASSFGVKPSMWFNSIRQSKLGQIGLFKYQKPKIGDIVVFQAKFDKETPYTKRILAGPKDKIQVKGGVVFINKQKVKITYKGPYSFLENEKIHNGELYEEELPNGIKYNVVYLYGLGNGQLDNTEEFTIPEGSYFMIGDNRHGSDDSRSFIGAVPECNIIGKAVMILISNGNMSTLSPVKWIKGMKWGRCFTWMI